MFYVKHINKIQTKSKNMATIANAFLDDFEEEDIQDIANTEFYTDVRVETIVMGDNSDVEENSEVVSDLLQDDSLKQILEKTEALFLIDPKNTFSGSVESNEEYQVILQANDMIRKIEDEIMIVHKHLCDQYASRFPELEQTVLHPVQYAKVVKKIKNDIDLVSTALEGIVSDHQILSTSISASATSGKPLPESDLNKVLESCDIIIGLDIARNRLLSYIKSRMLYLAPNLCVLVGADIASQLITLTGGLTPLARTPSCNIQTIGSIKKTEKTSHVLFGHNPHNGIIARSPLMLDCPEELFDKTLRMLSAKISLAARIDCHQVERSDEAGQKFLSEIKKKLEKWQEPLPAKPIKPLPLPPDKRKSKRAGKRYRKMREKYKVTELQRMKNRVGFNSAEDKNDEGEGFGMIGKSGVGGVMKIVGNNTSKIKKLERINKLMIDRERRKKQRRMGKGESSGLATSVVMTEAQGMSFVNPDNVPDPSGGSQSGVSTYFGSKSFSKIKM